MGHFYTKSGQPCHYQPDGKDTTLRHARKQDLVPSVTGILDVVSNPGLTTYFINQHLEAAWLLGSRDIDQTELDNYETYCKEVRQMAGEHSKQARDKGSAIHHQLEVYYSDSTEELDPTLGKYVSAVTDALKGVYGISMGDVESERTFATEQWGGAVDISSPEYVLDFKYKSSGWEKKKDGTPKKIWYDSHIAQLAAYRFGLEYPKATCANVFISPEAEVYIKEYTEEELKRGLKYFAACNSLWRLKNNFGEDNE